MSNKPLRFIIFLIFILNHCALLFPSSAPSTSGNSVQELLQSRIASAEHPFRILIGEESTPVSPTLSLFYERRAYAPAWSDEERLTPSVEELVAAIRGAAREGLRPADYHLQKIEALLQKAGQIQDNNSILDPGLLADLDLILTDAFLLYSSHLSAGKINPEEIDDRWSMKRKKVDPYQILEEALTSKQIAQSLEKLTPQPCYQKLRRTLLLYRDIASKGGWPIIPEGPILKKWAHGDRVEALWKRLSLTGDLAPEYSWSGVFDDTLQDAVRRFQKRHGLDTDGIVGPLSLVELNIPVEHRISQVELNMERCRWLPRDLGRRYILVNITGFKLDVVEDSRIVMTTQVVVGKQLRRTPVLSANMTYLVFNPYWNVPAKIAVEDILPLVRKNASYLEKNKYMVFQVIEGKLIEIDPRQVDWANVSAEKFPYRFRQEPGNLNALGRIKFVFPNQYGVFIHDTPSRGLFAKSVRAYSSGCIRVEKPVGLAKYVLSGEPDWTREKILEEMKKNKEKPVRLPEGIPVHLVYWTAWVDEDDIVNFRRDIYEMDDLLDKALQK